MGTTKITSGEFQETLLKEDIQVKEAEALRATINMLVIDMPEQIRGKTLVCKVDNLVLKAVWERKGTSKNLMLNNIGKQISTGYNFWGSSTYLCNMLSLKRMYPISSPYNHPAWKLL